MSFGIETSPVSSVADIGDESAIKMDLLSAEVCDKTRPAGAVLEQKLQSPQPFNDTVNSTDNVMTAEDDGLHAANNLHGLNTSNGLQQNLVTSAPLSMSGLPSHDSTAISVAKPTDVGGCQTSLMTPIGSTVPQMSKGASEMNRLMTNIGGVNHTGHLLRTNDPSMLMNSIIGSPLAGSMLMMSEMSGGMTQMVPSMADTCGMLPPGPNQIFVFSTEMANCAAQAVSSGQYRNIIDFHVDRCGPPRSVQRASHLAYQQVSSSVPPSVESNQCQPNQLPSDGPCQSGSGSALANVAQWVQQQNANLQQHEQNFSPDPAFMCDMSTGPTAAQCYMGSHGSVGGGGATMRTSVDSFCRGPATANSQHAALVHMKVPDENLTYEQRQQRENKIGRLQRICHMYQMEMPPGGADNVRMVPASFVGRDGMEQMRMMPAGFAGRDGRCAVPYNNPMSGGPMMAMNYGTRYGQTGVPQNWNNMASDEREWNRLQEERYMNKMSAAQPHMHRHPHAQPNSAGYFGPGPGCHQQHCMVGPASPLPQPYGAPPVLSPHTVCCPPGPGYSPCEPQSFQYGGNITMRYCDRRVPADGVYGFSDAPVHHGVPRGMASQQSEGFCVMGGPNFGMATANFRQLPGYVGSRKRSANVGEWENEEDAMKQRHLIPAPSPLQFSCINNADVQELTITRQVNHAYQDSSCTAIPATIASSCPQPQLAPAVKSRMLGGGGGGAKKKKQTSVTARPDESKLKKLELVNCSQPGVPTHFSSAANQTSCSFSGTSQKSSTMSNITSASLAHLAKGVENMSAVMQQSVLQGGPFRSIQMPEVDSDSTEPGGNGSGVLLVGQRSSANFGSTPAIGNEMPRSIARANSMPQGCQQAAGQHSYRSAADESPMDALRGSTNIPSSYKSAASPNVTVSSISRIMNGTLSSGSVSVVVQPKAPNTISYRPTCSTTAPTPGVGSGPVVSVMGSGREETGSKMSAGLSASVTENTQTSAQQPTQHQYLEMLLDDKSTTDSNTSIKNSAQFGTVSGNMLPSSSNCLNSKMMNTMTDAGRPLPSDATISVGSASMMPACQGDTGPRSASRPTSGTESTLRPCGGRDVSVGPGFYGHGGNMSGGQIIRPPYGGVSGSKMISGQQSETYMRPVVGPVMMMGGGATRFPAEMPGSMNPRASGGMSHHCDEGAMNTVGFTGQMLPDSGGLSGDRLRMVQARLKCKNSDMAETMRQGGYDNSHMMGRQMMSDLGRSQHCFGEHYYGTADAILMSGGTVMPNGMSASSFGSPPGGGADPGRLINNNRGHVMGFNPVEMGPSTAVPGVNPAASRCASKGILSPGGMQSVGIGSPPCLAPEGYYQQYQQQPAYIKQEASSRVHLTSSSDSMCFGVDMVNNNTQSMTMAQGLGFIGSQPPNI